MDIDDGKTIPRIRFKMEGSLRYAKKIVKQTLKMFKIITPR